MKPTRVRITPGAQPNCASGNQNQLNAKVAASYSVLGLTVILATPSVASLMSLATLVSVSEIILLFGEFLPKRSNLRNAIQSVHELTVLSKHWLISVVVLPYMKMCNINYTT